MRIACGRWPRSNSTDSIDCLWAGRLVESSVLVAHAGVRPYANSLDRHSCRLRYLCSPVYFYSNDEAASVAAALARSAGHRFRRAHELAAAARHTHGPLPARRHAGDVRLPVVGAGHLLPDRLPLVSRERAEGIRLPNHLRADG